MTQIEITAHMELDSLVQKAKRGDVVLTREGHAVAILRKFDDDELYWYKREHDPEFIASIARARARIAKGQTNKLEDVKKRLGIGKRDKASSRQPKARV
jgi:hypothetical protein